jgi:hypothetical protein
VCVTSEQEQGTIDEDMRKDRDKDGGGKAGYRKAYRESFVKRARRGAGGRCGPSV